MHGHLNIELKQMTSELQGFRSGIAVDPVLVVHDIASMGDRLPTFRATARTPSPTDSTSCTTKTERNYHTTSTFFFSSRFLEISTSLYT
jgi:hypothetical protein